MNFEPETISSITFTVGRLLCGKVRDYLESLRFQNLPIEYIESSGWLERTFTVKGPSRNIIDISKSIDQWAKENDYLITNKRD